MALKNQYKILFKNYVNLSIFSVSLLAKCYLAFLCKIFYKNILHYLSQSQGFYAYCLFKELYTEFNFIDYMAAFAKITQCHNNQLYHLQ